MLTEDDVIADLSRLRDRSAGIEYTGRVPLTRRSVPATIVPVAAVAAVATLGTAAVVGVSTGGSGAGPSVGTSTETSAGRGLSEPTAGGAGQGTAIKLVSAKITLGGKTIAYQHAAGADPFGDGWQLAIDFGASLPANATRFDLGSGEVIWVADSPDASATSVLIVRAGPHNSYLGAPSSFSRAELEEFVRTNLHGQ